MNKGSYNYKYLIDYCGENNIILLDNYENTNRDTRIIGKCLIEICELNFDKVTGCKNVPQIWYDDE